MPLWSRPEVCMHFGPCLYRRCLRNREWQGTHKSLFVVHLLKTINNKHLLLIKYFVVVLEKYLSYI